MAKTILFDTGTDPAILWGNAQALGIDLGRVDAIVISHLHGDHTGGLISILEKKPGVTVYVPAAISVLPESTGQLTLKMISHPETTVVQVLKSIDICSGVRLTSQLFGSSGIPEVSLLLETKAGGMLITGCAHPGVVNIVRRTAVLRGKPVEAVIGGFHLNQTPDPDVLRMIADLKTAGVVRCGATHCTGDPAIALFRTAFGKAFIPLGVGRTIDF
jgi:7,8-dihydropterin-6-yl-methyl-4-(beta-D-ribofuranosyl)aminobenzene 5'-phosphate synthase